MTNWIGASVGIGLGMLVGAQAAQAVEISKIADGFDTPWAVDILPDGAFLVTEIEGELILVSEGQKTSLTGVPRVSARGQGGLLDVTVARDFATSREIFLSYSKPQPSGGSGTAVSVARIAPDNTSLTDIREIFDSAPGSRGGRHFGSRVVEGTDGTLFITLGDRGDPPTAQDLGMHNGSVVRINRDGSVPRDNPFVGQQGVQPEIWSYGHRNIQGAGLDAAGQLWTAEHGARGGDEVNRPQQGANYGWPVISFGRHYSGASIGQGTSKPGMEQPELYWDPSIAPSGLLVYSGKLNADWRGDILIGSLKFDYIARLKGAPLNEVGQIKSDETARVRDIIEAPDGAIWFVSAGDGAIYRLVP